MTKLMKILPMLAIVAGIGGAFGFSAQQDPCLQIGSVGYSFEPSEEFPVPELPPAEQEGITRIDGELGPGASNYTCSTSPNHCRWIYIEADEEWKECPGTLTPNPM